MCRSARLILFVAMMWLAGLPASAQEPTERWKNQNTIDDRVEGFGLERDVAAGALTLVDFHAYREPLDFDTEITIEFLAWQPSHARVVAREKTPVHGYYMQKHLTAIAGANRWSYPPDVIRATTKNPAVDFDHLGLVVRLGTNQSDTFRADGQVAPVILRRSSAAPLQNISQYSATFLPDTTVDDVSYSVVEGCEGYASAKPVDGRDLALPQYKDNPFTIVFQAGREGFATLRLTYKIGSVDHPALTYCFWHAPKMTDPVQNKRIAR